MSNVSEHYNNEFYYPDDLSDMELLQKPAYFKSQLTSKAKKKSQNSSQM